MQPAVLFGLHAVFYQIELSRVRVDVEFQSFMIPTNITIELIVLIANKIEKQRLSHD